MSGVRRQDKPRVLLVGPALSGGGGEHHFERLARNIFSGHVGTALFRGKGLENLPSGLASIDLGWQGFASYPRLIWRLRRHVQAHRFDALLAFGFYPNIAAWFALRGLRQTPKLILTEITRPKTAEMDCVNPARRLVTNLLRGMIYPRCDLFLANSIDGVEESIAHYGVPRARAHRVPNIIDVEELEQSAVASVKTGDQEQRISICIAARLWPLKRVDTLIAAAAGLEGTHPWRVDIIGDGPEQPKLEALASRHGIRDRLAFHGWQDEPARLIAEAAILVCCSEYEGMSNSVLEALALRRPLVTSLCSSDARLMCEQGAALCFEPGDTKGLRDQLQRLLDDATLRQELGENGFRYAQPYFLVPAIRKYEALVAKMVAGRESVTP